MQSLFVADSPQTCHQLLTLAQIWEFVSFGFATDPFGKLADTPQSTNVPRLLYIV